MQQRGTANLLRTAKIEESGASVNEPAFQDMYYLRLSAHKVRWWERLERKFFCDKIYHGSLPLEVIIES